MGLSKFATNYNNRCREREEAIEKINVTIEKRRKQIQRLEKKRDKLALQAPDWVRDVMHPLAQEIAMKLNQFYDVKGPFGIRAEVSIYIIEDPDMSIIDQGQWSITITPHFNNDGDMEFYYDTGEVKEDFAPGTVGSMNGMNNVEAPLPENIDEIIKLLKWCEPFGRFSK